MKKLFPFILLLLCGFAASGSMASASELFPFVISFDAPRNATNVAHWLEAPAGKNGFIRVEDGRFVNDKGRVKFWATNTCFAANFLSKEEADRMADRMARFGINCVRLHHMDMRDLWVDGGNKTRREFDKGQLDRLDYYVAALKKRGIYVNLNLHVSRTLDERDGFPPYTNGPSFQKGVDNYYRPIIEENKRFARDILEHVNPYTGKAYKDEPAVAMIEVNNENSILSMWGGWGGLETIEGPYLEALQKEWNAWLKAKYKNDVALRRAWKCTSEPMGKEMLAKPTFPKGYKPNWDGWTWEVDEKTDAPLSNENGALRMDVRRKGKVDWHPQLIASSFAVEKGKIYTLEVKVKADKPVPLNFGVRMNHDPWEGLGFDTQVKLENEWQVARFSFTPAADDANTRLTIGGFQEGVVYELKSVSLKPGGRRGLEESQTLRTGRVPVVWKNEAGIYGMEAIHDFCDFLVDIERRYWDEMRLFLKNDVKIRQPLCGTQLAYGSTHAQAAYDYCDDHAYWNHPHFPGRAWDGNNWYLHNRALVNHLDKQILGSLATRRVAGKPHTISEYNHPYPNQYAAEGLPLLAAFGAFQDWDGIFTFAYSHSNNAEPKKATSFFDTCGNTVQMAHMIAGHALFCSDVKVPPTRKITAPFTAEKERDIFKQYRDIWHFSFRGLGLDERLALTHRVALDVQGKVKTNPATPLIPDDQKIFGVDENDSFRAVYNRNLKDRGYVTMSTDRASLFTGFVESGHGPGQAARYFLKHPDWQIAFGPTNLGWATVSLTRLSTTQEKPERYLLVATGEMLNTEMKPESLGGDKITVGNRWGREPVCCEGVPVVLMLKSVDPAKITYWPLDESGNRRSAMQAKRNNMNEAVFELKPEYKTIWYEVEIQ